MAMPRNTELHNRVIALARTGMLYAEVARIVGVHRHHVGRICRIYGGMRRKRGRRVGSRYSRRT